MKADESVCKLSQLRPLTFLLEVSGGTVPQTSTFKYVSYGAKRLQYYRKKKKHRKEDGALYLNHQL
jgi:hypothetical protein